MKKFYECIAKEIEKLYEKKIGDGDMEPIVLEVGGKPIGRIQDGDAVIFACRRGEREVQLTEAFVLDDFDEFPIAKFSNFSFITLINYDDRFKGKVKVVFDFPPILGTLAEVLSKAGLKQLHTAESEKYAHVTFFFNGRRKKPFEGEEDLLVKSPEVDDVSKVPELSVHELARAVSDKLDEKKYNFILVNLANGDVIGHLPNMNAKVECVKHVSTSLEKIVKTALNNKYAVVITADHGLIEVGMRSLEPPIPNLGHTTNPVPMFVLLPEGKAFLRREGRLANVAPTVLEIMGINKPSNMDHESMLLKRPSKNYSVLLIVVDGWGIGPNDSRNPIYVAKPKFWMELFEKHQYAKLSASGEDVGLLPGRPGNSEAGHTNIGAGRIVLQDEVVIEKSLKDGSFSKKEALLKVYERKRIHIISMLSKKSSHGTYEYALRILEEAKRRKVEEVYIHFILNRHGVEGKTAATLLRKVGEKIEKMGGLVTTVVGRKWALDRDKNYERTEKAYRALVFGDGIKAKC
ncbi:MAG: hypothetical protein J7L34_02090 [Thermotogaceae bacterium]|nr:hypothetical protein [Thermotogaceae bacterium]